MGVVEAGADRMRPTDYPALFVATDASSRVGQRTYVRLVRLNLLIVLIGGASGVISGMVPTVWGLYVTTVLLLAGFFMQTAMRNSRVDQDWYGGRVVAEAAKAAAWRYMLHLPPLDGSDDAADATLLRQLRDLLVSHRDLSPTSGLLPPSAQQITPVMRRVRALPFADRKVWFLRERLDDQIGWYEARAVRSRQVGVRWFWLAVIAQGLALAWSILRIAQQHAPNLVSVFSSVAAAATALSQLGRHDELARSYGATAQELLLIKGELEGTDDEATFARVALDAEATIGREQQQWSSKRG